MWSRFPRWWMGVGVVGLIAFMLFLGVRVRSGAQAEAVKLPIVSPVVKSSGTTAPGSSQSEFGYGLVMAGADSYAPSGIGFNWMMVFNPVGYSPAQVLQRVKVSVSDLANLPALSNRLRDMAWVSGADAYQIGNEPNLSSEWGAAPDAAQYAQVLCTAYFAIKQVDPAAIIVSGGLAPTGRVPGTWNGHPGHDGLKQDEREFLREFITASNGYCFDALGYNALGFRAKAEAAPDVNGGSAETDCANGLCFRSVEKAYQIMQSLGLGNKPVWATEVGWLTAPPAQCLSDSRWAGRTWQIVTANQQAANLVGAFRYARFHWPWMKALFVFNYNFDAAPYYDQCEQMRYYSIQNAPAFGALWQMSKQIYPGYLPLVRKS